MAPLLLGAVLVLSAHETEAPALTSNAFVSVEKSDSADPVIAGASVTYTITIANVPGNAANTQNVMLTDTLPAGFQVTGVSTTSGTCTSTLSAGLWTVDCNIGTVTPNSTVTVTISVTVDPGKPFGVYDNTVTVTGGDVSAPWSLSDVESTTVVEEAILTIDKSGPATVLAGEQVTYSITVTNAGPSNADSVTLTDALPPEATFGSITLVSAPDFSAACISGPPPSCTLGTLGVSGTAVVELVVTVPSDSSATSMTNTATADSEEPVPPDPLNDNQVSDSVTTTIARQADLSISKTDDPDPVIAGQSLTYTVVVTNLGPSDAQGVVITDTLPTGTSFVSLDQSGTTGWSCTTPDVGSGGTATCTRTTLAAAASTTFTLVVAVDKVGSTVENGTQLLNQAEVTSDTAEPVPDPNSNTASANTTVIAPDMTLTKSAVPAGGSTVSPGETITYTIAYENSGDAPATGFVITDVVSSFLGGVSPSTGGVFDSATSTITWLIGDVAPGSTGSVFFSAIVRATSKPRTINNTAEGMAVEIEDPLSSNTVTHNVEPPDIVIFKSADRPENNEVKAFDVVTYTLQIENRQGEALSVVVTDSSPPHMSYVPGSTRLDGSAVADVGGTSPLFSGGLDIGTVSGKRRTITFQMTVDVTAPAGSILQNWGFALWNLGTEVSSAFFDLRVFTPRTGPALRQSVLIQGPTGRTVFINVFNEALAFLPATGYQGLLLMLLGLSAFGFGGSLSSRIAPDFLRRRESGDE